MRRLLALAAALLACAGPGASGHRTAGLAAVRAGRVDEARLELRMALVDNPGDREARAALGRLELAAGRPGAALPNLDAAWQLGERGVAAELAAVLAGRGGERARVLHRGRAADLERAVALAPTLAAELAEELRRARLDALLAAWAEEETARLRGIAGADPVLVDAAGALGDPAAAPPLVLEGLARRAAALLGLAPALPLLEAYRERGGADAATLGLLAAARRSVDPLAPVTGLPCPPAGLALDLPCAVAGVGAGNLDEVLAYAGAPAHPEALAAILAANPRGWLEEAVGRFVLRESAGRPVTAFPAPMQNTLLALRGDARAVATELADAPGLPPGDGALAAWWPEGVTLRLPARAPGGPASRYLPAGPRPGCPGGAARDSALAEIAAAEEQDPGLAARLADDWIAGEASLACRAADVAALFRASGDFPRALALLDRVLEEDPRDGDAALAAATVAAVAGLAPRAVLLLEQAEVVARDPGAPSLAVGRVFLDGGRPIDALAAGRQALALGGPRVRWDALVLLGDAARAAGRDGDAAAAAAELARERPAHLGAEIALPLVEIAELRRSAATDAAAWARVAPSLAGAEREEALARILAAGLADPSGRGARALRRFVELAAERPDLARAVEAELRRRRQ